MIIKFSRHARRRANLYKITEIMICDVLEEKNLMQGSHIIVENVLGLAFPLKIIIEVKGDIITVISNYPAKRRKA